MVKVQLAAMLAILIAGLVVFVATDWVTFRMTLIVAGMLIIGALSCGFNNKVESPEQRDKEK